MSSSTRVFVTGGSGFVGSAVVRELIGAGHQVLGLARSDESAAALTAAGARVHRGSLDDPESLRSGVAAADGVIHCAFLHDWANYAASAEMDRRAIETIGDALAGSGRPFIVTGGVAMINPGHIATENDPHPTDAHIPRVSEQTALALVSRDVRVSVVRLASSVHGEGDHGFVPILIGIAREKGVSAYVGDGHNRWPAVHRLDAARLYRLALENAPAGSILHGVADEGIPLGQIAEVIGRHLNVPVISKSPDEAADHFGWFARFVSLDSPASSALTQQRLRWHPTHEGLIADLERGHYFEKETISAR